jgi:hypothetical protein
MFVKVRDCKKQQLQAGIHGPTGALHRMCQQDLPIVTLDARQQRSGMTAKKLQVVRHN